MSPPRHADALPYFAASGVATLAGFPFWKAAAIGQSGWVVHGDSPLRRYWEALKPPWRGCLNACFGKTCARTAIFYWSDAGTSWLRKQGSDGLLAVTIPPVVVTTLVQVINQPFVRAAVTLQDHRNIQTNTFSMLWHIRRKGGFSALWLGTSAALLKTIPKYIIAIRVKDSMESGLAPVDNKRGQLIRSAKKSVAAGIMGAAVTNPFDVVRNEMFKNEQGLCVTLQRLQSQSSLWPVRGCGKNVIAVAMPIASTIFLLDVFQSRGLRDQVHATVFPPDKRAHAHGINILALS